MAKPQLSGAQKRKLRREREEVAHVEQHGDVTWSPEVAVEIARLGPPPLADSLAMTTWHLQITSLVSWQMVINPNFPPALARSLHEGSRTAGMLSVKSQERQKLGEASKKLNSRMRAKDQHGVEPYKGKRSGPSLDG